MLFRNLKKKLIDKIIQILNTVVSRYPSSIITVQLDIVSKYSLMLQNYITNNIKFFLRNNKVINLFILLSIAQRSEIKL